MGKYFNSSSRAASITTGLPAFFAAWLGFSLFEVPSAVIWALLLAAILTLIASVVIPLQMYWRDKRYVGIEDMLPQPILLKANVSIQSRVRPREGYLYLTEDRLYLFVRDHKPYASQELSKAEIRDIKVERSFYMTFRVANQALYALASAQCEEILDTMRRNGWNVQG